MTKLWGGRFKKGLAKSAIDLSYSIESDKRLYHYDLKVNAAHAKALEKAKILTKAERLSLERCLKKLEKHFEKELLDLDLPDEDIHSCIERLVTEELGDLGKKLHTGKSRNDQVATDVRLYLKDELSEIESLMENVLEAIWKAATKYQNLIFPGFTHLQVAQPILLAHHFLAYFEKFQRDLHRFHSLYEDCDECPLGSAAMVGSNYPLDRKFLAKELGFSRLSQNSMDAVSARDVMLHILSTMAISMTHFSQFSEELVIWSSPVVGFLEIGDDFTTGSSIMPQKKNPDMAELVRGKTGPMLGNFVALHEIVKGLPLSYNRDLQEDKPLLFNSIDQFKKVLRCFAEMIPTLEINEDKIAAALKTGQALATEIADYLVLKKIPFRDAHHITGKIVRYAIKKGKDLSELSLKELQSFSPEIGKDITKVLTLESAVASKNLVGGTSKKQVTRQLKKIQEVYQWKTKP